MHVYLLNEISEVCEKAWISQHLLLEHRATLCHSGLAIVRVGSQRHCKAISSTQTTPTTASHVTRGIRSSCLHCSSRLVLFPYPQYDGGDLD